jgi:hypothetical protein
LFGYKDTFLALLHSPSTKLKSFLHYVNKLPYGGENLTHQFTYHNFVTTKSQLLHTFFTPIYFTTNYFTPIYFTPIFFTTFYFTPIFFTPIFFTTFYFTPIFFTTIYFLTFLLHNKLLTNHTIYIPSTTIYNQIFTTNYTKRWI